MTVVGIILGIFVRIGKYEYAAGNIDKIWLQTIGIAVIPRFTVFAVLLIIEILLLAAALLNFPLVPDTALTVLALQRLHTVAW